ncbi:MAG: amidohydrolase [Clostridia bacterium]
MKLYIKNATLLSMDEKREKVEENMDIEISGNQIIKIGKNLTGEENAKMIDATGKVVMPGLINTHAHIPMSIFRETVDGLSLQEWLQDKIWPMEDQLTKEDIYQASKLSFMEMIRTGTTTINDMYFMTESIIEAAIQAGIRLQTTRTLTSVAGEEDGQKKLEEFKELLEKYRNQNSRITFNAGIHGLYTSSREYVDKCIAFAKEEALRIHMHFCENTKEVEDIKQAYGESPVSVIEKDFKGIDVLLAHCVKLNKEEIARMATLPIHISHCPVSNLKLGCGVANIAQMVNAGMNVSLGTDGQGSGSNLDLFETMKYTALLQKGIQEDAKQLPAYQVIQMATMNGAKALGMESQIGSIEEGKLADMIILNLDTCVMQPVNDLCSDIVYNAKGENVETTIVNGEILMENKQLRGIEGQEVYEKCRSIIERIKQ